MVTRNVFITGMVVLAAATFIFFPNTPPKGTPAPADGATETGAVGAGDFELFLAALALKESGGDPNAVCPDGCCVGLYQITEIYVDDINRIGFYGLNFTYDDRLDPLRAETMVVFYVLHYVINRLADYDWSTLARVHHGGPNGAEKEYTKGFGEDVVRKMVELRR